MWEVIKDARLNRWDLRVLWLDLANVYGAVPHVLILKPRRFYYVPDDNIKIKVIEFAGVYERFFLQDSYNLFQLINAVSRGGMHVLQLANNCVS